MRRLIFLLRFLIIARYTTRRLAAVPVENAGGGGGVRN
jgi:hypothetical protein